MPTKSILILTPGYLPLLGGMEQQCYLLASEFTRRGHSVTVLTEQTKPSIEKYEIRPEATVHRMSTGGRSALTYLRLCMGITSHLIKNKYSFIIIRTLTFPAIVVGLLKLLRAVTCPTFVTAETGGEKDDIISLKTYPLSSFLIYLISQHDFLNSINSTNTQHYHELNFPENKLVNIPNGVDTSMSSNSIYPKCVNTFLFLGQMRNEKGLRELILAFSACLKDYPHIQLYLAGDGPETSYLENFIAEHNCSDSIHYLGRISQDKIDWFFHLGDCLVLPSYSEGMPLVVLEAAVRKKVIISTDVGDLKDLFGDQILFCEKRSVPSLERTMKKALSTDFTDKLEYEKIVTQVDIKDVARQYLDLLS
jgi:glycosyltransferase involved in cell wall biosynthesis